MADEKEEIECFIKSTDPQEEKYAVAKDDATKASRMIFHAIRAVGEVYDWSPGQTMIPVGLALLMFLQLVENKDKDWLQGLMGDPDVGRNLSKKSRPN